MTEEQYHKLNDYLNLCFQAMEEEHSFFLRNINKFVIASEKCSIMLSDYDIQEENAEVHLTALEVFALGREIVEKLCPCYLQKYNSLLDSGVLDFSYGIQSEDYNPKKLYTYDYDGSHFCYHNFEPEININRRYNYEDVCTLIHEFLHMTNTKRNKKNPAGRVVKEFISIYFEIKALLYLIEKKGIEPSQIFWNMRLLSIKRHMNDFNHYSFPLACYEIFGEVHPKYINETNPKANLEHIPDLSTYLYPYYSSKERFENDCKDMFFNLERLEQQYQQNTSDKNISNIASLSNYLLENSDFIYDYQYILGTILTYYAIEHCKVQDILRLNDIINNMTVDTTDNEFVYGIDNLLCSIGIDLSDLNVLEESMDSMRHVIEKYSTSKRK